MATTNQQNLINSTQAALATAQTNVTNALAAYEAAQAAYLVANTNYQAALLAGSSQGQTNAMQGMNPQ